MYIVVKPYQKYCEQPKKRKKFRFSPFRKTLFSSVWQCLLWSICSSIGRRTRKPIFINNFLNPLHILPGKKYGWIRLLDHGDQFREKYPTEPEWFILWEAQDFINQKFLKIGPGKRFFSELFPTMSNPNRFRFFPWQE